MLEVLIRHAGYPSLDAFAAAVNARAWQTQGLRLGYDHTTVKRWLAGSTCQYPEAIADVLSAAWGVPIPTELIWPHLRAGRSPALAHLLPAVAARTVEELANHVGTDMLTRRQALAEAMAVTAGASFVEPLSRWLSGPRVGLPGRADGARIGMDTVTALEGATAFFADSDSTRGGGLAREAAAGQLKFAVDLARDASYSAKVGDRLLVALADLARIVGWASHDVGMDGPAQRYFVYGLQAAHASADPRASLVAVRLLACLVRLMIANAHHATGAQLAELALARLPRNHYPAMEAKLWSLKAAALAPQGRRRHSEMRSAIGLSFDLSTADEQEDGQPVPYTGAAELSGMACLAYHAAAIADPDRAAAFAAEGQKHALTALALRPPGYGRSRLFDQIGLARARFLLGEPEQAAADGHTALESATTMIAGSSRAVARLRRLRDDCTRWDQVADVRELRGRLQALVA